MILACHQPQYLAWPGYYHKMARCDVFVYLDLVQYKKRYCTTSTIYQYGFSCARPCYWTYRYN